MFWIRFDADAIVTCPRRDYYGFSRTLRLEEQLRVREGVRFIRAFYYGMLGTFALCTGMVGYLRFFV